MPRPIILNGHTLKITRFGISLEVQGLKPVLPLKGDQVQSLVWELRFHMLLGVGKKTKTKKDITDHFA